MYCELSQHLQCTLAIFCSKIKYCHVVKVIFALLMLRFHSQRICSMLYRFTKSTLHIDLHCMGIFTVRGLKHQNVVKVDSFCALSGNYRWNFQCRASLNSKKKLSFLILSFNRHLSFGPQLCYSIVIFVTVIN